MTEPITALLQTTFKMPYDSRGRYQPPPGLPYRSSQCAQSCQYPGSTSYRQNRGVATLLENLDLWATELSELVACCSALYNDDASARNEGNNREARVLLDSLRARLEAVDSHLRWDGLEEAPRPIVRRWR